MNKLQTPTSAVDSLIFDMDGTLWDAVPSYCAVWNMTIEQMHFRRGPVQYAELVALMGKPLAEIFDALIGETDDALRSEFLRRLFANEDQLMPRLGGKLYPEVEATLQRLSDAGLRLYMVSNCSSDGLNNFLRFTGLDHFFEDTLTYGETGVDKDVNILTLKKRYNLQRPVYVGDIRRDADSTHAAGIEFVWAAYGFGLVDQYEYRIDRFSDLAHLFI